MPLFPFYPNYYNYYYPHYNKYYKNDNTTQNQERNANDEKEGQENKNKTLEKEKFANEMIESPNKNKEKSNNKRASKYNSFTNINISALLESDLNTPIIEILGIKLYLDDLIIIGLLFFLYKEDVQDEILFGILLLLLLS